MNKPRDVAANMPLVAERIAAAFARHGIREVFGQSIPSAFFLAAPDYGIRQIGYRTENAGGIMADAYARISGRITIVTAQNGPAATLLVAPLAEALKASVPILALVQEVPIGTSDKNAFQEFDHHGLFASVAKWVRRVDHPDRIEDYVDQAIVTATSGRPGPVVLLLPMDFASTRVPPPSQTRRNSYGNFPLDRVGPDPDVVARAAELLREAKRPLIVAGGGVHLSGACEVLARLQETQGIPVATTLMGKGSVDETHPLSLGVIGFAMSEGSRTRYMRDFVRSADVILLVGNRTNQNGTDGWTLFPEGADLIHIDVDPQEIGRNYEAIRIPSDARLALQALLDRMQADNAQPGRRARLEEELRPLKAKGQAEVERMAALGGLRPEALLQVLDRALTPDDIVVADASYSSVWVGNNLTARKPGQRFLTPRGLAGLGWGLPFALGAKLARPDARVVAIVGDGGFGHCWSELETARRVGISITVIVLNNAILGYQKHGEFARFGRCTEAVDFKPVDHAAIARACGCGGATVSTVEEFEQAFGAAFGAEGTTVIDAMVPENAYPPINLFQGKLEKFL